MKSKNEIYFPLSIPFAFNMFLSDGCILTKSTSQGVSNIFVNLQFYISFYFVVVGMELRASNTMCKFCHRAPPPSPPF